MSNVYKQKELNYDESFVDGRGAIKNQVNSFINVKPVFITLTLSYTFARTSFAAINPLHAFTAALHSTTTLRITTCDSSLAASEPIILTLEHF